MNIDQLVRNALAMGQLVLLDLDQRVANLVSYSHTTSGSEAAWPQSKSKAGALLTVCNRHYLLAGNQK